MSNKNYQEFKKRRDALTNKIGDGVAIIFNEIGRASCRERVSSPV